MSDFSEDTVDKVWRKGITLDGWNSDEYRIDAAGAMMVKSHRGLGGIYDWEIDHVIPKAMLKKLGVPESTWDDVENLRPFNAKNNVRKSDDYPEYTRVIVFDESNNMNVESELGKVVNEDVQRALIGHYGLRMDVVPGDHTLD